MASTERLVVALLAAGSSTRFGAEDKLAAMLGDRPLIRWAAQAALSVAAARHLLVMRAGSTVAVPPPFETIVNHDAAHGLSASLRLAGQAAQGTGADALLILLADMPFVGADHLAVMLAGADGDRPLFSRVPGGAPQPPALFPSRFFTALAEATGDAGARRLAGDAGMVEAGAEMLLDIDTPDDLERARQMLPA